tara:strand:- start:5389 stop:6504 length:1116 start_codon:yes stop_codon:yes gene_type:complete
MKIVVVGAGNGGSFTALFFGWHGRKVKDLEVELIYNPNVEPERVGQATLLDPPGLLWAATGFNWYDNNIHATFKSGILYEGWGKKKDKFFHHFAANVMAMHYCPFEMQKSILESGHFKVTESEILDIDNIDADYVFDCRGKPKSYNDYKILKNPTNSAILAKPKWDLTRTHWSSHIATPDGWTFVIPTHEDSPSHDYCVGYCYNDKCSTNVEAEYNLKNMFDVEVKKHVRYKNYVANKPIDGRVILNGNRLFFLEPMESSSVNVYLDWIKMCWNYIFKKKEDPSDKIKKLIDQVQNFVLWHYQFGSKYDTEFWDYAGSLKWNDTHMQTYIDYARKNDFYQVIPEFYGGETNNSLFAQWPPYSFKVWLDGVE